MIDLDKVRADIPATKNLIHFNNAGASLMAAPAYRSMLAYQQSEQEIGGYETAEKYAEEVAAFYSHAASLIRAKPQEIAFFDGSTRAWQTFFYSLALKPGDRILTSYLDYGSNYVGYIDRAKRDGIEIDVIEGDSQGVLDVTAFERAITDRTALISLSHIPTANGIINPAAQIGRLAKQADIPFLLDACQSAGQLDLDVTELGCTALSAAGRKYLRGPRGSGFLYVDQDFLSQMQPVMLDQHGVNLLGPKQFEIDRTARRFENFEVSFASRIGLGEAMHYATRIGTNHIENRITELGKYCRESLQDNAGAEIQDLGPHRGGIVMFSKPGRDPREIRALLSQNNINIWISAGSGSLIEFQKRGIESLARASVHYFNTHEEIDRMVSLVAKM
ncbi:MAG: aminotransferase class V-fold PLP-dependent enzyme [Acidiferrobacterales bacterium]|nr:aminotransferase class V-fold PLP-dependent enzyme [Acidiferrobacterales bacterium]